MKVKVHTSPLDSSSVETRKSIAWDNSSDRKWLMNHLHWAMNNQQIVTLYPESN